MTTPSPLSVNVRYQVLLTPPKDEAEVTKSVGSIFTGVIRREQINQKIGHYLLKIFVEGNSQSLSNIQKVIYYLKDTRFAVTEVEISDETQPSGETKTSGETQPSGETKTSGKTGETKTSGETQPSGETKTSGETQPSGETKTSGKTGETKTSGETQPSGETKTSGETQNFSYEILAYDDFDVDWTIYWMNEEATPSIGTLKVDLANYKGARAIEKHIR